MTRVAVIGTSIDAIQIGCEFALGGCAVQLLGPEGPAAGQAIEESLRLASSRRMAGPAELERARSLIAPAAQTDGRVALIVEALGDAAEEKARAIAAQASGHPEAIVVTTSESVSATEIGEAAGVGERMLGARFGAPPMLCAIVELSPARDTPARLADRAAQLLSAIGKRPVILRRELPGMISGALELALLRECRSLIERGVADAEQIDAVARERLARVWAAVGPLGAASLRAPGSLERLAVAAGDDPADAAALSALVEDRGDARELAARRDAAFERPSG